VLGARRQEFDMVAKVWTVPPARMKAGREHRVPLSDRAVEIVTEMGEGVFVFPGARRGKPLSPNALNKVLGRMEVDATVHGFRSSFRDYAGNETHFPREVCEAAMAHVIENQAEAAYRRGDALEKRRELMKAWADYCVVSR
jgi:integrase